MTTLNTRWIFILSLIGALLTIPFISKGWSSLDDGFYALTAHQLLEGQVLHRDIFTQYIGYQHFIHAFLLWIIGDDYLSLRYILPIFTFLSGLAAASALKEYGRKAQLTSIIIISGFNYLLFNNPSTSWTCEYIAITLVYLLKKSEIKQTKADDLLIGGLLGMAFCTRHPTAIFLGMAVLSSRLLHRPILDQGRHSNTPLSILTTSSIIIALIALLIYGWKAGIKYESIIWIATPCAYLISCLKKGPPPLSTLQGLILSAAGFFIATLPAVIYTTYNHAWPQLIGDLNAFPADYSRIINAKPSDMLISMCYLIANAQSPITILTSIIVAACLAYPLYVLASLIFRKNQDKEWILSPLTIIATFHCLVILALPSIMYLSYSMPMIILSFLEKSEITLKKQPSRWTKRPIYIAASLISFTVMCGKLGGGGIDNLLGDGEKINWIKCPIAHCSLETDASSNILDEGLFDKLEDLSQADSTKTIIPWSYHYNYSARPPHPTKITDARIPIFMGKKPIDIFRSIASQQNPIVAINKSFSSKYAQEKNFCDLLTLIQVNGRTLYDDAFYKIVSIPKNINSSIKMDYPMPEECSF